MDRLTDLGCFRKVGDVSIDIDSMDSLRQKPGVFHVAGHMYKVAVDSGAVLVNRVDRPRTLFHSFIEFFTHRLADCSITSRTVRIQQRLTGLLSQPEVGDVKSSIKTDDSDSGSLSEDADEKVFSKNADLSESTSSNDIIHLPRETQFIASGSSVESFDDVEPVVRILSDADINSAIIDEEAKELPVLATGQTISTEPLSDQGSFGNVLPESFGKRKLNEDDFGFLDAFSHEPEGDQPVYTQVAADWLKQYGTNYGAHATPLIADSVRSMLVEQERLLCAEALVRQGVVNFENALQHQRSNEQYNMAEVVELLKRENVKPPVFVSLVHNL